MTTSPVLRPELPEELRRGAKRDEEIAAGEARRLLARMAAAVGLDDLSSTDLLDVGCGQKFTQAILSYGLPIGSYTGVDVYRDLIDFLRANVDDPRFSYAVFDVHNEMYNPGAPPMTAESDLGVGTRRFDLVCGFSLFTHLAPPDFEAMLRLMRRYVRDDGHLYFSAFLNEVTEGGHGLLDTWMRHLPPQAKEEFARRVGDMDPDAPPEAPAFVDFTPAKPLLHAVYSRPYAVELVERSGWALVEVVDPTPLVQHQFICRPA